MCLDGIFKNYNVKRLTGLLRLDSTLAFHRSPCIGQKEIFRVRSVHFENLPMQYTDNFFSIKTGNFTRKMVDFNMFAQNI